jgi:hypothetical protein
LACITKATIVGCTTVFAQQATGTTTGTTTATWLACAVAVIAATSAATAGNYNAIIEGIATNTDIRGATATAGITA